MKPMRSPGVCHYGASETKASEMAEGREVIGLSDIATAVASSCAETASGSPRSSPWLPETAPGTPGTPMSARKHEMALKLGQTIKEREELDQRIRWLRTELRLCETSREGIVQMELWLAREVAELEAIDAAEKNKCPLHIEDFLAAPKEDVRPLCYDVGVTSDRPDRSPRDEPAALTDSYQPMACRSPTARHSSGTEHSVFGDSPHLLDFLGATCADEFCDRASATRPSAVAQDWETGLDTLGIARCSRCGLKFPSECNELERHDAECSGRHV